MSPITRSVAAIAFALISVGCASEREIAPAVGEDPELERTFWQGRAHYRDASGLHEMSIEAAWPTLRAQAPGRFRALIVYLHGCDGIGSHGARTADWLADAGYLVLAPDSFARVHKPLSCDPSRLAGGLHREVLGWRQAEADRALRGALGLPGVDATRLVLMGFSEGAIATATYRGVPLAARVLEGWTCRAAWPEYAGLAAEPQEAVLALSGQNDPWFRDSALSGDCAEAIGPDGNRRRVLVFRPPHAAASHHDVLWNLDARRELLEFLSTALER